MFVTAEKSERRTVEAIPLGRRLPPPAMTLTELAGCVLVGTACAFMWVWVFTPARAVLYVIAMALAFVGGGFRIRLTTAAGLFFLVGGLFIIKALLYPPVPWLVLLVIGDILLGFAILPPLGMSTPG